MSRIALGNVSVVKLQKPMKSHILFPCCEVDDESGGDITEGVELIRLTKIHHVPDQSLLIGYFSVELEVVETHTIFS